MLEVRDPKLKDFMDSWHIPVDEEMAALRRSNEADGVPLILTETESVLRLLLDLKRPSRILELGTAHGYSALLFAKCCPDAVITTIDRNPGMTDHAKANFESFSEGSRIDFRIGEALDVLRELADGDEKFDFVFIDAGKSHYRDFFDMCETLCEKDAFIVCDNILLKGWLVECEGREAKRHRTNIKYMRQFLEYINGRDGLDVTLMSGGDGLAVIRFMR
ncbi:MAG: O-methyltransferase [Mogibacterium sp.]|nr:O-methyltransferase [Mogibacterium sp.]